MSKRFVTLLASVAALAMLVGGCGSSDEEPLTKAEFIKQGDAICTQGNNEIRKQYEVFLKDTNSEKSGVSKDQGMEIAETIFLPAIQAEVEGLQDLPAPTGDEAEIEAIIESVQKGVEKGEEEPKTLFSLKKYPFNESNELAQKYGFKVCGV